MNHTRITVALGLLLVIAGVGAPGTADADTARAWQGARQPVKVKHLRPAMKSSEGYGDKYTFNADFDGGGSFYYSLTISNLGLGDGKMEAKGRLTVGGESFRWKKNLDDDEWKYSKKGFSITAGPARMSGEPKKLQMSAKAKGAEVELTFEAIANPWRPRDGRIRWGDEGVSDYTVFPLMKVTGRYKKSGGEWTALTGTGYGTRSWSSAAAYDVLRRAMELRVIDGDKTIYMRELAATEDFGKKRIAYLLVTRGNEVLYESFDHQFSPTEVMTDTKHDNRYKVPEAFTIVGKDAEDPARMIRGKVTKKKLRKRREPLKKMNAAVRAVASQYSEPVSYDYDVDVLVEVKVGAETIRIGTVGRYEVNHLNK